ncbi:MAG: hypothetical protein WKG01_01350 [Kofleriaceae bacterium]
MIHADATAWTVASLAGLVTGVILGARSLDLESLAVIVAIAAVAIGVCANVLDRADRNSA